MFYSHRKILRYLLAVIFFCIVPIALYFSFSFVTEKKLPYVEKVTEMMSSPVTFLFSSISHSAISLFHNYVDLQDAREEANRLSRQNSLLEIRVHELEDIASENERLRKLLLFTKRFPFRFVVGEIVGGDPSYVFESIKLNRGAAVGIQPGMGVLGAGGVVGVVIRTTTDTSDVLLVIDPNTNLDVIVARNRRRGILQGGIHNIMQFKYLERGESLFIGDEIVTSGLTGAFPNGIPVGKVSMIRPSSDGLSQVVEVEPAVSFSEISEAFVLINPNRDMEIIKKIGGSEWVKKIFESNAEKPGA